MRKNIQLVLLGLGVILYLQGCASGSTSSMNASSKKVQPVVNFSSAISAYDATRKLDYLKQADKYAASENERAILEKKMVDYLGADKVFTVNIKHKLSKSLKESKAYYLGDSQRIYKKNALYITIKPNPNLPFKLQYNTYRMGLGINETRTFKSLSKDTTPFKKGSKAYCNKSIILGPQNNWSLSITKTLDSKVLIYKKSSQFLSGRWESKLIDLSYTSMLSIHKPHLIDKQNGLMWENDYSCNAGKPNTLHLGYESVDSNRCVHLGKDWRLPTKDEIYKLNNSGLTERRDYWSLHEDCRGHKTKYVRCVKDMKPQTLKDNTNGLEWQNGTLRNDLILKDLAYKDAKTYCSNLILNGRGWRLPSPNEYMIFIKKGLKFNNNQIRLPEHYYRRWYTSNPKIFFNLLDYSLDDLHYTEYCNTRCVRSIR